MKFSKLKAFHSALVVAESRGIGILILNKFFSKKKYSWERSKCIHESVHQLCNCLLMSTLLTYFFSTNESLKCMSIFLFVQNRNVASQHDKINVSINKISCQDKY